MAADLGLGRLHTVSPPGIEKRGWRRCRTPGRASPRRRKRACPNSDTVPAANLDPPDPPRSRFDALGPAEVPRPDELAPQAQPQAHAPAARAAWQFLPDGRSSTARRRRLPFPGLSSQSYNDATAGGGRSTSATCSSSASPTTSSASSCGASSREGLFEQVADRGGRRPWSRPSDTGEYDRRTITREKRRGDRARSRCSSRRPGKGKGIGRPTRTSRPSDIVAHHLRPPPRPSQGWPMGWAVRHSSEEFQRRRTGPSILERDTCQAAAHPPLTEWAARQGRRRSSASCAFSASAGTGRNGCSHRPLSRELLTRPPCAASRSSSRDKARIS